MTTTTPDTTPDTSHDYHRPAHVMVEQWETDGAWVEVVDADGVVHTYRMRAEGGKLLPSHTTEPVATSWQPTKE